MSPRNLPASEKAVRTRVCCQNSFSKAFNSFWLVGNASESIFTQAVKDSMCYAGLVSVCRLSWNGRQLSKVRPRQWQEICTEPERNCDLSVSWRLMWVPHTMQWYIEYIFLKLLKNDFPISWWPRVSIFLNTFLVSQRMTFVFSYQSLYYGWISPCSCLWWLQNSLSESLTTKRFTSVWPFSIFF